MARAKPELRPCGIVRISGSTRPFPTSSGQRDSGLFELNFNDERYLPFEYICAVSRWCIELPSENNYFELNTISDAIIRLNYTAREGGELLRKAANGAAQRHICPGMAGVISTYATNSQEPGNSSVIRPRPSSMRGLRCD
jgi:hypothetical protein